MEDNLPNEKQDESPSPAVEKKDQVSNRPYRHYFFEFILVFLAVVFGFMAESFREYLTDRSKERVYINGLIQNLQDDVRHLDNIILLNKRKLLFIDSSAALRKIKIRDSNFFKTLNRVMGKGIFKNHFFKSNDAIISEMKFSGKLTLLPRQVLDSLTIYDQNLFEIYEEEVQYEHHSLQSIEFFLTLTEDWSDFDATMTANEQELKFILNQCINVGSAVGHYTWLLANQKKTALHLIQYLKDKYNLADS